MRRDSDEEIRDVVRQWERAWNAALHQTNLNGSVFTPLDVEGDWRIRSAQNTNTVVAT